MEIIYGILFHPFTRLHWDSSGYMRLVHIGVPVIYFQNFEAKLMEAI